MSRKSKRLTDFEKNVDLQQTRSLTEAIELLKDCPGTKFDQSVDVALQLGVDPRKSDQHVRGTVTLPHGTGKTMRIVAIAKGDKIHEALDAGADEAGHEEIIERISKGWTDFDALVVTPDMMREVGKLGKVLGPRGLMPTPKAGTVTTDLPKAIGDLKKGKIEFKVDRHAAINNAIGKLSFDPEKLAENFKAFVGAIQRAKPAAAKGHYLKSLVLSSTMGPGVKIDVKDVESA